MFVLFEAVYTDKESISLYKNFDTETDLLAEFETKFGQDMKSEDYNAAMLVAFDHTGRIYNQGYTSNSDYSFSPRLIWIQSTSEGESDPDQSKKDSSKILEADYHIKKGAAMKNTDISSILLLGIDGNSVSINDYWVRIQGVSIAEPEPEESEVNN